MDRKSEFSYGLHTEISGTFPEAIAHVKEALKAQGFGILSEIDVQKILKEKTGEDIEPYTILGACNPQLASRAIAVEHEIGLLLPCNLLVHSCGGRVTVAAQDPAPMMEVTHNEALKPIAQEARTRLQNVLSSLQ